jgi:hypothetical protein
MAVGSSLEEEEEEEGEGRGSRSAGQRGKGRQGTEEASKAEGGNVNAC